MTAASITIPLDSARTVRVEVKGPTVQLSMILFGITGHAASIPPAAASAIGAALKHCAEFAQENELLS